MATPEAKELALVDKVDFKILHVANDEKKLPELLKLYLAPLILKAASEHHSVRSKVIQICQRLKTFVQPPGIVLPVAALLSQYKATDSPLVRHLDLTFIQHSIGRIDSSERAELVSIVLKDIGKNISPSHAALFNVVLHIIPDVKVPPRGSKESDAFRDEIGLSDPEDSGYIAEWLTKLLLLKQNLSETMGLTEEDIKFLTLDKPETWTGPNALKLAETRLRALNLLASGAFTDKERFLAAIYASASSDGRMSSVGDDMLKRSTVDLEDKSIVERLFTAHIGLPSPYRAKILNLLSRSATSVTYKENILNVVKMDLEGSFPHAPNDDWVRRMQASGLEQTKLHKALFEYMNWVARIGPSKGSNFTAIAHPLIDHLVAFIRSQGWPVPENLSVDQVNLRYRAYETIGVLARSAEEFPEEPRTFLLSFLFRSLSEDPSDVVAAIDGALPAVARFFQNPGDAECFHLHSTLLTYMSPPHDAPEIVRSTRPAAVKCANQCLPFSDATARWIDILAVASARSERRDVVEEGRKGLDPWTYYANEESASSKLPDWVEMVRTYFTERISSADNHVDKKAKDDHPTSPFFANFGGDKLHAYPLTVTYCTRILFLMALGDSFKVQPGWELQLENKVRSDLEARKTIRHYLANAHDNLPRASDATTMPSTALLTLLTAALEGMLLQDNDEIVNECAQSFVDLASLAPKAVLRSLAGRAEDLLPLVMSHKSDLRMLGSRACAILGAHPAKGQAATMEIFDRLMTDFQSQSPAIGSESKTQGSLLCMAHLASRLVYYYGLNNPSGEPSTPLMEKIRRNIFFKASSLAQRNSTYQSMSQFWTAGLSCLPQDDSRKELAAEWVEVLSSEAKKSNDKAIIALGRLAVALNDTNDKDSAIITDILTKLYDLHEIKQTEVQFAVGEAITAAVACWDSEVVQLTLDVEPKDDSYLIGKRGARVSELLKKLLQDCKTTKPSLLKASGIWLFCLIQNCSHLPEIQLKLRESQVAFMRLLSARDELVQETASRGLALVYERGDPALREDLVKDLVAAFTGSGPKLEVDKDTELFDAGALPTGEGKSITSYKDIVSLANEVGDQSLIYKFMSLATNAATWSTRSAFGRFGLSNILSESEVDPKLYPKLYRYRFDPNLNVQKSMNDIWKALVKDSSAVIDTHFEAILSDLLKSILGKEWRVRQASCAAIADLIGGQKFDRYKEQYQDIWSAALRVLDDVKSSVCEAAMGLCMNLSNTLVRQLEESSSAAASKTATAMIGQALPFLLSDKGIESGVEEVKGLAIITVMKISKNGGPALRPYIADMVTHLLNLLSTIEPDALNYYYQRSGEESREKIDKLRSSFVSQSPIFVAIEDALRQVDAEVMPKLLSGVEETIKSAIGMPTKIGCSNLLSSLSIRHAVNFAPHSGRFLKLMYKCVLDRNDEVSRAYAKAAAYMMRVAPDAARLRFVEHFADLYFAAEDEGRRRKVGDVVLALSKISPDHFNALEAQLLPLAYLGKHDAEEYVATCFSEVWDKHAGSSRSVVRYVGEITGLVERALSAAQWALKHAGALTTGSMVKAVLEGASHSAETAASRLDKIWPTFEKSLLLKTFDGKEKLLDPLADMAEKGFGDDALLKKIVVREAKRNNDTYRVHAFKCLWRFAKSRKQMDMLDDIVSIATPHLDALKDEDRMDVDGEKGREDLVTKTATVALEAVARGYCRGKIEAEPEAVLKRVVSALGPYLVSSQFDRVRREVWYSCAADLLDDAKKVGDAKQPVSSFDTAEKILNTLDLDAPDVGTEDQRAARMRAVDAFVETCKKGVFGAMGDAELLKLLKEKLQAAASRERSLAVKGAIAQILGKL
ncbi:hypothetical protein MCOR16_007562 [Pyricularia oryzae]|nr:hypothetical protein MCOR15_006578 [Pyricularia oryzae]KAI6522347.1 hypothetical protein MCOR16_007562 [Pyricularia oryzae]